jgi:CRP-like cAMP-binding protein
MRPRNQILSALSPSDLSLLEPFLKFGGVALRKEIERPNRAIENIYFPESGIVSVVAVQPSNVSVEVGLIGREGMSGISFLLGASRSPHATYVQVAGEAQWISATELRSAVNSSRTLQELFLRYAHTFMVQIAHTAIANARARIDQRLARWILMALDRTDHSELQLTHEFLAIMLGVRRAGVTEALRSLKRRKMIHTARSEIIVINRKLVEALAGNLYGVPEQEYRRLIG